VTEAIADFARRLDGHDPFVVAFRMSHTAMVICDPNLPDNPIIYANAAFERLTGFSASEVMGRNCRFMQGPDTDPEDVDRLRSAIRDRQPIELDLLNHKANGAAFWNRLVIAPVFGDDGAVRFFVATQLDVTIERHHVPRLVGDREFLSEEIKAREVSLAEQDARLQQALKAAGLGVWTLDLPAMELHASTGCKRNFGRPVEDDFTYRQLLAAIHPEDRDRMQAEVLATLESGQPYNIDYRILTPNGEQRWVAIQAEIQYRADGSPLALSGFSTDISERKFAEEHRAVLAGEMSHRVKNTLATVSAVVAQTLRDAPDMVSAISAVQGRIASMATAHDLLLRDEGEGASIGDIVQRVLSPFADANGTRFEIEGPAIKVSPQVTLALSMALYELVTNAIKYGALSVPEGRVTVKWLLETQAERHFRFTWTERGGPPVRPPERRGFGSRMIERVLQSYVNGRSEIKFLPEGIRFELSASL
jgi:PAS domain S-box-containing protein